MSTLPTQPPDSPEDNEPDTIATPEGDNEYAPDQPLTPSAPVPERPRGDEPHSVEPLYPAETWLPSASLRAGRSASLPAV